MKKPPLQLAGQQFGQITVLRRSTTTPRNWLGTCSCNPAVEKELNGSRLGRGFILHCGCQKPQHGHTKGRTRSPTYIAWQNMKLRKERSKYITADGKTAYVILYDLRWKKFKNFLADMGERPPGTTLDRIDPLDCHYAKHLCRWSTRLVQDYNKTNSKYYFAQEGNNQMAATALGWANFFTEKLGKQMTPDEFKAIVKFFPVGKLWCTLHRLFPDVAGLRKMEEDEKRAKTRALFAAARNDPYEEEYEDTGYVEEWEQMPMNERHALEFQAKQKIAERERAQDNHDPEPEE